ncbi:MAG TPA: pilus assembly protein CpaE, partial [Paralcaligenes sp.]
MSIASAFGGKNKEDARNASFVAFVADDASTQEVQQVVAHLGIPNALVARGGIDAAIDHLGHVEKPPQRLVVDISGIDLPLLALGRLADACDPSVQVYVLGDQNDVRLYRTLLQAGVHDYLV